MRTDRLLRSKSDPFGTRGAWTSNGDGGTSAAASELADPSLPAEYALLARPWVAPGGGESARLRRAAAGPVGMICRLASW